VPGSGAVTTDTGTFVLRDSDVTVMVAVPSAWAVTKPLVVTVATLLAFVAQVTTRPVNALPFASRGVAVSCTVCPTVRLALDGTTVTDATGVRATVIDAVAVRPSQSAVTVAVPIATLLTNPVPLTVATAPALVDQVTVRPASTFPLASRHVAVNWAVCPMSKVIALGVTCTDATGISCVVIAALPVWPSLVAVIVAAPTARAVTRPLLFTVATVVLLLDHATTRFVSTLPDASRIVAVRPRV
jgi:hypothetical protein